MIELTRVKHPKIEENIYPVDTHLIERLERSGTIFMNELIQELYPIYKRGVVIPDPVIKSIREYNNSNDYMQQFIDMCVDISDDANIAVKDIDLYNRYKQWSDEFIGKGKDTFGKFKNTIKIKFAAYKISYANGYFNKISIKN